MKNLLLVSVLMFFAGTIFAQTATAPSSGMVAQAIPIKLLRLIISIGSHKTALHGEVILFKLRILMPQQVPGGPVAQGFLLLVIARQILPALYNGQVYTITGLYIDVSTNYIGLFGYASAATIKNVGLQSVNVTGDLYVGGLIGNQNGGTATGCSQRRLRNGNR